MKCIPVLLRAAVYASALPYVVHDSTLFISGTYNESLGDRLWDMVYKQVHEETHSPKLAVIQASLLYLQRLPARRKQTPGDTCSRSLFLGSTVALAMSLGLHLECRPWGIPGWEKRLRRRLWWAVYMEDKWTSLLLGRPPLIRPDEWDVLGLDDGDFEEGSSNTIASIFPYFTRLARLVEEIHQTF